MGPAKFNFYRDQPLFGLDIGSTSLKVMQLSAEKNKTTRVVGFGVSTYYPSNCTVEGVIANKKILGEALYDLLQNRMIGSITTKRVACTVPSSHTFSRPMKLPIMDDDELAEAVRLEVEQYVPVPIANLYLDWEISRRNDKEIELLTVAIPRKIIDSYIDFLKTMGLEPVTLEPTMNALARLFNAADPSRDMPSILIDFGSVATDLAVFDQSLFVNSTITAGSDALVTAISEKLGISIAEARNLKNSQGISQKQSKILDTATPTLENLVREIQKIIRYYHERSTTTHRAISQIVLTGGGSTMPGLGPYVSKALNMPARKFDPWASLNFGNLAMPDELDRPLYLTVAGEAILNPKEVLA